MRLKYLVYCTLIAVAFYSCNKSDSLGLEIQPQDDKIATSVDTIHLQSTDYLYSAVSAQCIDSMSMILGEYSSNKYGGVKADLVVQFAPPVNYEFPPTAYNAQPDSLVLFMYYRSYFGSESEPLEISIYELNKSTPDYHRQYLTDFDPNEFLDINESQLLGRKLITAVDYTVSPKVRENKKYVPSIKYYFSETVKNRFFNIPQSAYKSVGDFLNHFKGLYITTSYGKSTLLYLFEIDMKLFYHYSYRTKTTSGKDTTMTVNTFVNYPAGKDVRQINRIVRSGISGKIGRRDSVNYVVSTSGAYPKVTLPIRRIRERIETKMPSKTMREIFVNSAEIVFEPTEIDASKRAIPSPATLLLIPEEAVGDFIKTGSLKAYRNNEAQVMKYSSAKRSYAADVSRLLNKKLKDKTITDTSINYLLIPVDIYTDSKGEIIEYRITKRFAAAVIRSGKNAYSPLRLTMVYSGF